MEGAIIFDEATCEAIRQWLEHTHAELEKAPNGQLFPTFSRETTVSHSAHRASLARCACMLSCFLLVSAAAAVHYAARCWKHRVNESAC